MRASPLQQQLMGSTTSSNLQKRNASVTGQQVRFLDRDPVPSSLRGREGWLEQESRRMAVVRVEGSFRHVPKDWLVPAQGSAAAVRQGSTACSAPDQSVSYLDPNQPEIDDTEGDDDPITQQAWYSLLEVCLELNLSPEDAQQVIAEAAGIPPDELDPSQLTWRQYLQAIERLEELESA
jgi:hypothetical protein